VEKRLGFIHDKFDIKVLILFILGRLSDAVSLESLADITMLCDDGISYFDFAECLSDLRDSDHVSEKGGRYLITDKGRENGEITESGLPYSVRVRAERSAAALAHMQKRSAMITATHNARSQSGYKVELAMSDGVGPVMKLELFAADEKQAALMEKNFKADAESLYDRLLETLTRS